MKEKLIEYLKENLRYAEEMGELNNPADWNMQEGVLLDYKEAQLFLEMLTEKK